MSRYPSPRAFFTNFKDSDLPFHKKVQMALKNNAIKVKNGTDCCGNHGEPGC